MITELVFSCRTCGDPVACRIVIPIDLQAGAPAIYPPQRCVVSSAFDKTSNWIFTEQRRVEHGRL